jgi:alkanesulfonate monooxygenase SsuD/methylene tetrahydromethanopterin reductase-like flavin-dependent oxidoreductase (luciferase family)
MPADRTKTTLSIALIVFAMLAFVLGVTTYVFSSKQAKDAKFASQAADSKAEAERKLGVETEEKTRIRDVLGTDKETADQIEAERTELFETNFADFPDDQRSYGKLVEWLAKTVAAKDDQLKDAEQRARALTA